MTPPANSPNIMATAIACLKAGSSIIPINHRTKKPLSRLLPKNSAGEAKWKPYQTTPATEEVVRGWFSSGIKAFAVVGGEVSGGLLIIDFDVPRFYEAWVKEVGPLADGLPVQQTGSGGFQVLCRCEESGGNQQLAWAPNEAEDTGREIAIETRGEGGYAVLAPSLHPSGNYYQMLAGDPSNIPIISQARAESLLA